MDMINYGPDHSLNLKTLIALSRTNQRIHRRTADRLVRHGLTLSQFAVLEALYHKGDMSIRDIITTVLSSGGNMTVVIHNLVKLGLVTRCVHPEDRRASLISITPQGSDKIKAIFPDHLADLDETFSALDPEEKQQLIALLKKIK
jgi:DNA-binding MarR family transcriptional regulator